MARNYSRRQFLVETSAVAAAMALPGCALPGRKNTDPKTALGESDLVLFNGAITTLDAAQPHASAVAVRDGRIVAVGADSDVLKLRGPNTRSIDLGQRCVIPGLNDSHLHIIRGGLNYNLELRWDGVPSLADAMRMLKAQ